MNRATHLVIASLLVLSGLAFVPAAHAAPAIAGVNPTNGPTNGGTVLNITGSGFVVGAVAQFLDAGGNALTLTAIHVTGNAITAITPAHDPGILQVQITNPDGSSSLAGTAFTYQSVPPPTITSVTPDHGSSNGNTPLVIQGSGFSTAFKPNVTVAGVLATVQSVTPTTIVAVTNAGTSNGYIVVSNPGDPTAQAISTTPFTYVQDSGPLVDHLAPFAGSANGGDGIDIFGSNFAPGATVAFQDGSNPAVAALSVGFVSTGDLHVVAPPIPSKPTNPLNVIVTNPDGTTQTLNNAYTVNPGPTGAFFKVTSVKPSRGPSTGGTLLTIGGQGFARGHGLAVRVGGHLATNVQFVNQNQITAIAPPCTSSCGSPASGDISVTNPDGTVSLPLSTGSPGTFFVYAVQVLFTGVQPSRVTTGGGVTVSLQGAMGFVGPCNYFVAGVPATSADTGGSCQQFTAPPLPPGSKDVTVVDTNGLTATLQGGLGYSLPPNPPTITQPVAADIVGTNGGLFTLHGTGFIPLKGTGNMTGLCTSPVVSIGGVKAYVVDCPSSTQALVLAPPISPSAIKSGSGANPLSGCRQTKGQTNDCAKVGITVTNLDGQSTSQTADNPPQSAIFVYIKDPPASLQTCVSQASSASSVAFGSSLPCDHASTDGGEVLTLQTDQGRADQTGSQTITGSVGAPSNPPQPQGSFAIGAVIVGQHGQKIRLGGTRVTFGGVDADIRDIRITPGQTAPSDGHGTPVPDAITLVVPHSVNAGPADVIVINPDGTSSSGIDASSNQPVKGYYNYDQPQNRPNLAPPDQGHGPSNGDQDITLSAAQGSLGPGATVFFGDVPVQTHFPEPCGVQVQGLPDSVAPDTNCVEASAPGTTGSTIKLRTPGHAPGTVSIKVVNLDGENAQLDNAYVYDASIPASLLRVVPDRASGIGGIQVTILGDNLMDPHPASSTTTNADLSYLLPIVIIDGTKVPTTDVSVFHNVVDCQSTQVPNPPLPCVKVRLPDHGPGTVRIQVINPDGVNPPTLESGFRYLGTSTGVSIVPNVGSQNGGTFVGLAGKGFDTSKGAASPVVQFAVSSSPVFATSVAVATQNLAVATTPASPSTDAQHSGTGPATVSVIDQDGQTLTIPSGFTYSPAVAPSFTSLSPSASSVNGGTTVTLKGSGFSPATTVCVKTVQPVDLTTGHPAKPPANACTPQGAGLLDSVVYVDSQTLKFTVPSSPAGAVDIVVTNPTGGSANTLLLPKEQSLFAYSQAPSPIVTSVAPTSGDSAGGILVTISGANFKDGVTVSFGDVPATNVTFVNSNTLTATLPTHNPGAVGVAVTTPDGQTYALVPAFTYTGNATVSTVTPTSSTTGPESSSSTGPSGTQTSGQTTSPTTLTTDQIIAANKAVTITVTRDGGDNLVAFTLPLNLPAVPQGVQIWRSNSPFVLVQTLDRTSTNFQSRSYLDAGAPLASKYLVTVFYAGGQGKASSPTDVPGFDQLGPGVSSKDATNAQLTLIGYVLVGILALFLVALLVVLVVRGRRPPAEPAGAALAPPAEGTSASSDDSLRHSVNCPNCGSIFEAIGPKPLRMECPTCGKAGVLR